MTTLPTTLDFQGQSLSIIDHNNQPWLASSTVASALGYKYQKAINTLYQKSADEFTAQMSCTLKLRVKGQNREVRIFSPSGCHLIAMLAKTEKAKLFRKWVLDVLEGLQQPTLPHQGLTPAEQHQVKLMGLH